MKAVAANRNLRFFYLSNVFSHIDNEKVRKILYLRELKRCGTRTCPGVSSRCLSEYLKNPCSIYATYFAGSPAFSSVSPRFIVRFSPCLMQYSRRKFKSTSFLYVLNCCFCIMFIRVHVIFFECKFMR